MNNEQQKAKELAVLLTAFADGKPLEWFNQCKWIEVPIGCLVKTVLVDYSVGIPFRIKPETKRIALTQQDLIDRIKEGKTMWVVRDKTMSFITDFNKNYVYFGEDVPNYDGIMSYTFLDGSPCYKEVECE